MMRGEELGEALTLARHGFRKFVAPDFLPQGVAAFLAYIEIGQTAQRIADGTLEFWVCKFAGQMAGMLAMRNRGHISLLFVDEAHFRRGVARKLAEAAFDAARKSGKERVSVHASPYAAGFYRAVGFKDTDAEKHENGMVYVPMECIL